MRAGLDPAGLLQLTVSSTRGSGPRSVAGVCPSHCVHDPFITSSESLPVLVTSRNAVTTQKCFSFTLSHLFLQITLGLSSVLLSEMKVVRHTSFLEKNESLLGCVLSLFALLKSKFKELGPAGSGPHVSR